MAKLKLSMFGSTAKCCAGFACLERTSTKEGEFKEWLECERCGRKYEIPWYPLQEIPRDNPKNS